MPGPAGGGRSTSSAPCGRAGPRPRPTSSPWSPGAWSSSRPIPASSTAQLAGCAPSGPSLSSSTGRSPGSTTPCSPRSGRCWPRPSPRRSRPRPRPSCPRPTSSWSATPSTRPPLAQRPATRRRGQPPGLRRRSRTPRPRARCSPRYAQASSCRSVQWSGLRVRHRLRPRGRPRGRRAALHVAAGAGHRGRAPRPAARRRTAAGEVKAFRRAWLLAFAQRIGERLSEARDAVVAEASGRPRPLPRAAAGGARRGRRRGHAGRGAEAADLAARGGRRARGGPQGGRRRPAPTLAGQAPLPPRPGALSRG